MKIEVEREEVGRGIIREFALGNAAVGLIPVPIVDLVAFTGVQLKMVSSLASLYKVDFDQEIVKSSLLSLAGSLGSLTIGAGLFVSMMKFIPPAGAMLGLLAVPLSSAAFTYAVGRVFLMHFESGGTLLNFDSKAMHKHFKGFYKEAVDSRMSRQSTVDSPQ